MQVWRFAAVAYFGRIADLLTHDSEQLRRRFMEEYKRKWNVFVSRTISKAQFVRYVGRYMRQAPVVERRLTRISESEVEANPLSHMNNARTERAVNTHDR